jgi:hypothetical protein
VLERCVAIQAQELRAGYLGVRARSTGLARSDVDQALASGAAVITSLARGTLHLIRSEDYPWLHVLTPQLATGNATRLRQEGLSPAQADEAVGVIRGALAGGPITRAGLREVVDARGIPTAGQALVHLLLKATLAGVCVRGPLVGGEQAFVLVSDWLGRQGHWTREQALRELGVRYLAGHVPATDRDLAKWAGIGQRDARAALAGVSPPVYDVDVPPPTLLGPWDELLMGWESRDWVLDDAQGTVVLGGIFRPFALVEGRAVATWSVTTGELRPFATLPDSAAPALAAELADVRRFLGDHS